VAARLVPAPGERILDLGCGTGRLTAEIAQAPGLVVVGIDRSAAMLAEAVAGRTRIGARGEHGRVPVAYVQGDGAALPFASAFDAVFSNATFHWVPDHDRLFRSVHDVLNPGGRLVAQCGGAGNLHQLYGRARAIMARADYAPYFTGWQDPWRFEDVEPTRARLGTAGFIEIDVSLTAAPTRFDAVDRFAEFIAAVCLRHELSRLPEDLRAPFIGELTSLANEDVPPLTLDYWRLNIAARKPLS
jgi:trans-aconitate 2-methyltransferase